MSPTFKRFWRGSDDDLEVEADNDPITIGHKDANALFADLQRTKADVFAAQHAATEATDALAQAKIDHTRAWEAMMKLFQNAELTDVTLPVEASP
jgi:Holliday junction resolvasome RuvABC DNA-binding subunit